MTVMRTDEQAEAAYNQLLAENPGHPYLIQQRDTTIKTLREFGHRRDATATVIPLTDDEKQSIRSGFAKWYQAQYNDANACMAYSRNPTPLNPTFMHLPEFQEEFGTINYHWLQSLISLTHSYQAGTLDEQGLEGIMDVEQKLNNTGHGFQALPKTTIREVMLFNRYQQLRAFDVRGAAVNLEAAIIQFLLETSDRLQFLRVLLLMQVNMAPTVPDWFTVDNEVIHEGQDYAEVAKDLAKLPVNGDALAR